MIDSDAMNINADKDSDEYLMALTAKHLPGSWFPYGPEMIILTTAADWIILKPSNNGGKCSGVLA